jgi:hypothetical protein
MRHPVKLPTIDGPLEAWCAICANRGLPPETAYCAECRPVFRTYRERLERRPARRIAKALFGPDPAPATHLTRPATESRPK